MSEKNVLCIATPPGFTSGGINITRNKLLTFLQESNPTFIPREQAETDESFLQVIPYITVAAHEDTSLLAYQRQSAGEERLAGKWSVGFGGHIDDTDCRNHSNICVAQCLFSAAYREVFEELEFSRTWGTHIVPSLSLVGLIYTGDFRDAGQVDRVHIGVNMVLPVLRKSDVAPSNETGTAPNFKWADQDELDAMHDDMELWSRVCLPSYDREDEIGPQHEPQTN